MPTPHVLVNTVGMSPPVVTSVYDYLVAGGTPIKATVLLGTCEPDVERNCKVLEVALKDRFERINVETYVWKKSDVSTTEDAISFMGDTVDILLRFAQMFGIGQLHLNLAGGRKTMSVAINMAAQLIGGGKVYHVIHQHVNSFNIELERAKKTLNDVGSIEDLGARMEAYKQAKQELEPVLFPPIDTFRVIEMPLIPYPADYLKDLIRIFRSSSGVPINDILMPEHELRRLERVGLVRLTTHYRTPSMVLPTSLSIKYSTLFGRMENGDGLFKKPSSQC